MTWNIAAGQGDLFHTAEIIRALGPDLVALQEVDVHWSERSGFEDQPGRLARTLGMLARFGPIYQLPGDAGSPPREYGLAILSRLPIAEFRNHEIPRLSTQTPGATEPEPMPGFIEVVVEWGSGRLRLFNTHLDYRADPRVRQAQVAAMLAIVGDVSGPTVLAGDLNAPPTAPELVPLFQRLRDAWADRDGAGFTYPAVKPVRRIDYLLHSPALRVSSVHVPVVEASDHRPVVGEFARLG
jgi:endonuclease/exonuclease/phosphatase family metal-dependent hydrolase